MNKEDIYKKQLNNLFSDFQAEVPVDGWDKIESTLNGMKRASIARRNWYIGSVAAAALVLIVSILFINTPSNVNEVNEQPVAKVTQSDNITTDKITASPIITSNETILAKASTTHTYNKQRIVESTKDISNNAKEDEQDKTKPQIAENKRSEKKRENISKEEIDKRIKELQEKNSFDFVEDENISHKKPLMLAVNARGGLTSSQKTANSPMRLRSMASNDESLKQEAYMSSGSKNNLTDDATNTILANKNVGQNSSEMIHSQPYSFGVTVSKNIVDRLSVETGIVYTYLYSEAVNSSEGYVNEENQQFHFIGVPINFNYQFVEIGKLNLFASIGGMIEKDIHGVYKGKDIGNMGDIASSEGSLSRNVSLKNPQFSIDAGIGASYPLYGGLNIYAKIGGAYYFDAKNYEYKTIYSDKKIMLDLNAGIRFQF